jgi:hypothetical protein
MRLLLLTAAAFMGGGHGAQTITGTISANAGNSITVSSGDRSVTCFVPGKGAARILTWGIGARVGMACKQVEGRLVLKELKRLGVKEPQQPATTEPTRTEPTKTEPTRTEPARTEPTKTEPTRTEPTKTEPAPVAQPQERRYALGVVTALAPNYGVAVQPDAGGEPLKCAITTAPDSQQAAAKLTLGAHVGIVCRLDGGRYVLAGATLIS